MSDDSDGVQLNVPNSASDLRAAYPKPPSIADVRKLYPALADKSDGVIADKLYDVYRDTYEKDAPAFSHPRIKFYADINYDPYSLKKLPHDLGQVLSGATMGVTEPLTGKAETAEDEANRTAGEEMLFATRAAKAQPPPAVRGAGGMFQANNPRTFSNAAQIAATAKTPPSTALFPTMAGKLGAGGLASYGLLRYLKGRYPWLPIP